MGTAPPTGVQRELWSLSSQMKALTATHLKASVRTTPPCPTSSRLSPTTSEQPGGWPVGRSIKYWLGGSHQRARSSTWWNGKGTPLTDYTPQRLPGSLETKGGTKESRHRLPVFSRDGGGKQDRAAVPGYGPCLLPTRLRPVCCCTDCLCF